MIVERRTYLTKLENREAVVEMIKEFHKILDFPLTVRICTPNVSPFGRVVEEREFKDFAERQKFREDFHASEKYPALRKKWQELIEVGGGSEIWDLVE